MTQLFDRIVAVFGDRFLQFDLASSREIDLLPAVPVGKAVVAMPTGADEFDVAQQTVL